MTYLFIRLAQEVIRLIQTFQVSTHIISGTVNILKVKFSATPGT